MDVIVKGFTDGLTTMSGDVVGALGQVVPIAFPIAGAILAIGLIWRGIKKLTGR